MMLKVAVIEDADDNRDLLYFMLRDEFEVLQYSNGEEALRRLPENLPHVIVLDIWLPGMDGIEVLRRLRSDQRVSTIPVLALTAHAMTGDREKYLSAGFDAYVSKPIADIKEFTAMLRNLITDVGQS
jgi:CheY-like chemotaxis protein